MRMKPFLLFVLFAQLPFSCCMSKNKNLLLDVKEVDYLGKSRTTLAGNQLDWEVLGADDMIIQDSLLMFVTSDVKGQLKVFNLNKQKQVGSLCLKGRARNEFLQVVDLSKQTYVKDGDIYYPLMDPYNNELKEVNVSESIRRQSTVVTNVSECRFPDTFVLLDNDINKRFVCSYYINTDVMDIKSIPVTHYIKTGDNVEVVNVYGGKMKLEDNHSAMTPYAGNLYKHPDRNLVIKVHAGMDYLFFFDFDRNKNFAVHQKGAVSFDDILPQDVRTTFSDVAVTRDCIFILYFDTPENRNLAKTDERRKPELLVFDWDGNFLWSAKFEKYINRIAYDEKNRILYGINSILDEMYFFNLDEIN